MSRTDGEGSHQNPNEDARDEIASDPDFQLAQIDEASAKRIFASRLQRAMDAKGWNQSELAAQASKFLANGRSLGRDNVSNYINQKHLPGSLFLRAMARALGVEPLDLQPRVRTGRGSPRASDAAPAMDAQDLGDGHAFIRVNLRLPWSAAVEVLKLASEARS